MILRNNEEVRKYIEDSDYEDVVIFTNPDFAEAFIGIDTSSKAVYNYQLMVESLAKQDEISEGEAAEFIDYNTLRALPYMGEKAPVVVMGLAKDPIYWETFFEELKKK